MYVYVYMYIYIYVYVYMYIYIYQANRITREIRLNQHFDITLLI